MKIQRRFTKQGTSPYTGIPFTKRHSEIRNPDGSLVFEARDRVGGRTWSRPLAGDADGYAELGATWVGPTQDRVLALIEELGLNLFAQHRQGQSIYVHGDDRHRYDEKPPLGAVPPRPLIVPDFAVASTWIDRVAAGIIPGRPWEAPDAEDLDRQTLATWLGRRTLNLMGESEKNFAAGFEALFGAQAGEMSALFALHYVACAGNAETPGSFDRLLNTRNGAQERRIVEGAQALCQRMAQDLGSERLLTDNPELIGKVTLLTVCVPAAKEMRTISKACCADRLRHPRICAAPPPVCLPSLKRVW